MLYKINTKINIFKLLVENSISNCFKFIPFNINLNLLDIINNYLDNSNITKLWLKNLREIDLNVIEEDPYEHLIILNKMFNKCIKHFIYDLLDDIRCFKFTKDETNIVYNLIIDINQDTKILSELDEVYQNRLQFDSLKEFEHFKFKNTYNNGVIYSIKNNYCFIKDDNLIKHIYAKTTEFKDNIQVNSDVTYKIYWNDRFNCYNAYYISKTNNKKRKLCN